jgi:glycosyltransferase involved in cell wall biosynthesis
MTELTLVYPYYNNKVCLERQLELWTHLPQDLARRIEYVLVDDGSPEAAVIPADCSLNLTLLRVKENIPWNQHGSRNLGLKLAEGDWVIASDIDHLFPGKGLTQVLGMSKDPGSVYYFGRKREDGSAKHPHPNTFLIQRKLFWTAGGYDEDFCGHYGKGDILLRHQFERLGRIVQIEEPAIIELDHGATPGLDRKQRHNRWLFKRKKRLLEKGKYRNGRTVRFEWEVVKRWRIGSPR